MIAKSQKPRKEAKQSLVFPIIFGLLILLVVGFLVGSNWRIFQKRSELDTQLENLKKELQLLQERRNYLESQTSQLLQEEYLEETARERFNLKKPGEEVTTILLPEETGESSTAEKKWWNPLTW